MQGVHNDVHVEVYVKKKIVLEANGFDDYRQKFANILKSFTDVRKVEGFHTIQPDYNITLNYDGTVTITLNYMMYERPMGDTSAEKVWKSSGYYINHWVPIKQDSFELEDWKLKNIFIHVVNTSDDFGKTSDACDNLC